MYQLGAYPVGCFTRTGQTPSVCSDVQDVTQSKCVNYCRQHSREYADINGITCRCHNSYSGDLKFETCKYHLQVRIQGGGPGPPLDPRFWGPKIEHFWALFNFSIIFFASLRLAYYFFNMLLFQSSNSKIFQPCFTRHMISHLEVFVFSLSFTHFRLLGVHLSLNFF